MLSHLLAHPRRRTLLVSAAGGRRDVWICRPLNRIGRFRLRGYHAQAARAFYAHQQQQRRGGLPSSSSAARGAVVDAQMGARPAVSDDVFTCRARAWLRDHGMSIGETQYPIVDEDSHVYSAVDVIATVNATGEIAVVEIKTGNDAEFAVAPPDVDDVPFMQPPLDRVRDTARNRAAVQCCYYAHVLESRYDVPRVASTIVLTMNDVAPCVHADDAQMVVPRALWPALNAAMIPPPPPQKATRRRRAAPP